MDTVTVDNSKDKNRIPRLKCEIQKTMSNKKTTESELMSVNEYFDMVWDRYLEKYEKLHG